MGPSHLCLPGHLCVRGEARTQRAPLLDLSRARVHQVIQIFSTLRVPVNDGKRADSILGGGEIGGGKCANPHKMSMGCISGEPITPKLCVCATGEHSGAGDPQAPGPPGASALGGEGDGR